MKPGKKRRMGGGHKFKNSNKLAKFKTTLQGLALDDHQKESRPSGAEHTTAFTGSRVNLRKVERKESRLLKKKRRLAFSQKKPIPTKESIAEEKRARKEAKQRRRERLQQKKEKKKAKLKAKIEAREEVEREKEGLSLANKKEDKMIKELEKQLKLNKRKSKSFPKAFIGDGLDYLLETIDSSETGALMGSMENEEELESAEESDKEEPGENSAGESAEEAEDDISAESDENEDDSEEAEENEDRTLVNKSSSKKGILRTRVSKTDENKALKKKSVKKVGFHEMDEEEVSEYEDDLEEIQGSEGDLEEEHESEDDLEEEQGSEGDLDEEMGSEGDLEEEMGSEGDLEEEGNPDPDNANELTEDIYGRLRDAEGNIVEQAKLTGAYVPPAKRLQMAKTVDAKKKLQLDRVKKQIKGLTNRLSESNMQPVTNQMEDLFRTYSRADVTETLANVVIEACVSSTLIPERLITEHAMMLAILHNNIGSEVGAAVLQILAKKFNSLHTQDDVQEGKEIDNILVVFSHLYNFKVIHSLLIFDIIKKLVDRFSEKDIELLLVILKNVGFTLRKDDPAALKELIVQIQTKASSIDTAKFQDQSRVKFMLEIIMAIRNNNMRKIPNYDPSHAEHLWKLLRRFARKSGSADSQLRISLADLLQAEEKGRWWLVGSAWTGRETDNPTSEATRMPSSVVGGVSSHILELARKKKKVPTATLR